VANETPATFKQTPPCASVSAGFFFCREKVSSAEIAAGLLCPSAAANLPLFTASSPMTDATAIHGHDIIDLVTTYPDGIRLSQLMDLVGERFGRNVSFHTCSAMGMDLDGLLRFLEERDKVRITSGVVYPGGSPPCEH
jgi:probable metal-binding protein